MAKKTEKKAPVKKKAAPKKEAVVLDPNKTYDFVVSKASKHMKVGTYTVDGVMAQVLTDKGLGSVKS
jgi:hypothetical protein